MFDVQLHSPPVSPVPVQAHLHTFLSSLDLTLDALASAPTTPEHRAFLGDFRLTRAKVQAALDTGEALVLGGTELRLLRASLSSTLKSLRASPETAASLLQDTARLTAALGTVAQALPRPAVRA